MQICIKLQIVIYIYPESAATQLSKGFIKPIFKLFSVHGAISDGSHFESEIQ
jgi:hypothetical protein